MAVPQSLRTVLGRVPAVLASSNFDKSARLLFAARQVLLPRCGVVMSSDH